MCIDETEYRTVRLTEDAYQLLENRKRTSESFSDAVERIAGERPLTELAGILTVEEADEMRAAIRERESRSDQWRW